MRQDEYRATLADAMTEADLQAKIRNLARQRGFNLVYHTYNSRRSDSGFPDLVMVNDGRLVFAELKSQKKEPTPDQRRWLYALANTGAEVFVWRPSDLLDGSIDTILRGDIHG
jgi:hypothetical protein